MNVDHLHQQQQQHHPHHHIPLHPTPSSSSSSPSSLPPNAIPADPSLSAPISSTSSSSSTLNTIKPQVFLSTSATSSSLSSATSSANSSCSSSSSSSSTSTSPASPTPSLSSCSSFHSSSAHFHPINSSLLTHPSNHLASLSISSPTSGLQPNTSNTRDPHPIINPSSSVTHHPILIAPISTNNLPPSSTDPSPICPSNLPAPPVIHNTGPLQNRSIPPPLSLVSVIPKSSSSDDHQNPSDDLMTARCSQFPIESLEPRHPSGSSTSTVGSCRFQPYLPPSSHSKDIINSSSGWSSSCSDTISAHHPSRDLFPHSQLNPSTFSSSLDDSSRSSNDLGSSCSSLASSTKSSHSPSYFPPPASSSVGASLPFEEPIHSGVRAGSGDVLYPPLAPPGFSQSAIYPPYNGPIQQHQHRTSLGLAYPAAAFTPSDGSPPMASASSSYFHFDSTGAGRRHTVSAYASPMPIELGLVGNPELDESMIKEEKRRRNKESSQRFRDRTRERQREKQERLEYLERRTKELEHQLRVGSRIDLMSDGTKARDPTGSHQLTTSERDLIDRLQAENETLRSSLKVAAEEIARLQQLTGNQSPHSPLSIGQVYASLAQLSPPASTDFTSSSQSSSPAGEPSYFAAAMTRGTSPGSDSQRMTQAALGRSNSIASYSSSEHPQLQPSSSSTTQQQMTFRHSNQSMSAVTSNDFWEQAKESGNTVTGWQPTDQ